VVREKIGDIAIPTCTGTGHPGSGPSPPTATGRRATVEQYLPDDESTNGDQRALTGRCSRWMRSWSVCLRPGHRRSVQVIKFSGVRSFRV